MAGPHVSSQAETSPDAPVTRQPSAEETPTEKGAAAEQGAKGQREGQDPPGHAGKPPGGAEAPAGDTRGVGGPA